MNCTEEDSPEGKDVIFYPAILSNYKKPHMLGLVLIKCNFFLIKQFVCIFFCFWCLAIEILYERPYLAATWLPF